MKFNNNNIIIFSPQPWDDQFISKHHYAIEYAKNNSVLFISGPMDFGFTKINFRQPFDNLNLKILDYSFFLPHWFRFHMPNFYKRVYVLFIKQVINKYFLSVNLCIDFGCYNLFDNLDFLDAENKIFFPVDDCELLNTPSNRGCKSIFTVSTVIKKKFDNVGLKCEFINHGISSDFESIAKNNLEQSNHSKIRIGYAGNLFIKFLDRALLKYIVQKYTSIEFHFYGKYNTSSTMQNDKEWEYFLMNTPNIFLHGLLNQNQLAQEYKTLDAFLICYKSDYINFHSENSHKILEYLSSGKVIISTFVSLYENTDIFVMSSKDNNEEFKSNFKFVVDNLNYFNRIELQKKRKEYALRFTYKNNIEYILSTVMH